MAPEINTNASQSLIPAPTVILTNTLLMRSWVVAFLPLLWFPDVRGFVEPMPFRIRQDTRKSGSCGHVPVETGIGKGFSPIFFGENAGWIVWYFHTDAFKTFILQRKQVVLL